MKGTAPESVDAYILAFPPEQQQLLRRVRALILEGAPDATEGISYGMPAYRLKGPLIYFGAAKKHLGLYPTGSGIAAFSQRFEDEGFIYSKGAVQFPWRRELPEKLIREIVIFRVQESLKGK